MTVPIIVRQETPVTVTEAASEFPDEPHCRAEMLPGGFHDAICSNHPRQRMSTRRRAREIVLQLLYEADINDHRSPEAARKFIRSRLQGRKALTEFANALLQGTLEHREAIDAQLGKLATHWTLPRMPVTDRNVLRLGAYEILFSDTPGRVAVNEAIVLAKRYGDKNSPRFVNGVLDRLLKDSMEQAT